MKRLRYFAIVYAVSAALGAMPTASPKHPPKKFISVPKELMLHGTLPNQTALWTDLRLISLTTLCPYESDLHNRCSTL